MRVVSERFWWEVVQRKMEEREAVTHSGYHRELQPRGVPARSVGADEVVANNFGVVVVVVGMRSVVVAWGSQVGGAL